MVSAWTNLSTDDLGSYLLVRCGFPTPISPVDIPHETGIEDRTKGTESTVSQYNNGCPMTMTWIDLRRDELDSPFPVR